MIPHLLGRKYLLKPRVPDWRCRKLSAFELLYRLKIYENGVIVMFWHNLRHGEPILEKRSRGCGIFCSLRQSQERSDASISWVRHTAMPNTH